MKFVTYRNADALAAGVLSEGQIFDLNALMAAIGEASTGDLRNFLQLYGADLPAITARLQNALASATAIGAFGEVALASVITNAEKALCVGLNYADHVAETGRKLPEYPDIFTKFASSMIGPFDDIACSDITPNLDFEGELAFVISKPARHVREEDALSYIAGVMVLNDITARNIQYRGTQWTMGKAVDASTPCGPALVTLDEIGDVQALDIATRVNGVTVQSSNTRYQIFPLAKLVSYISGIMSLNPGDVITTGTPEGIGAKRNPPMWLNPGDVVEVEVEKVGLIRNTIR